MKILGAKIDWMDDYDNPPHLIVNVDKVPDRQELVYTDKHPFYFAEKDGYVSFFYWDTHDQSGYGGSKFDIITTNGPKTLIGPWSSSPTAMASMGFPMTYDVGIDDGKYKYSLLAGNITEVLFKEAIDNFCTDAHYVEVIRNEPFSKQSSGEQNEVIGDIKGKSLVKLEIARKGMTFNQSQAFKRVKRKIKYINEWNVNKLPTWIYFGTKEQKEQEYIENYNSHIEEYNNLVINNDLGKWGFEPKKFYEGKNQSSSN